MPYFGARQPRPASFHLGVPIMKVPLPQYPAAYSFSFIMKDLQFRMKTFLAALLALSAATAVLARKPARPAPLLAEIQEISRDLESITGLQFKRPVPSAVMDKAQLRKYLDQRVNQVMKPADIRAETITLQMLGLVPADYDLRQQTVDLLTEQAAAFYDFNKKKLFLVDEEQGEAGLMELAHELAHALADQNFHLEKYVREGNDSDDAATARMAVMEGQATWLMASYLHQRAGLGVEIPPAILNMMSSTVEQGATQYPVYAKSPLYVRDSLVFPYKGGMLFQDAVYRKLGKAGFAEVFRRAPVSTQQILHPEKYLDLVEPKLPAIPRIPGEKAFRALAEGTLGEFDYRVLLTQYANEEQAGALAPSLLGSRFTLLEHKRPKYPVLIFASKWESPAKADEFFTFYRTALAKKSKNFETSTESESVLSGRNSYGFFRVRLRDDTVESIEGLQTPLN